MLQGLPDQHQSHQRTRIAFSHASGVHSKACSVPLTEPTVEIEPLRPAGTCQFLATINNIFGHVPINLRASTGLPFFAAESQQWMESCTGQKIDFDRLNLASVRTRHRSVHELGSTKEYFRHNVHPDLPDRSVVLSAFHEFISSAAHRHFPFLHPGLLPYTLETAYDQKVSEVSPDIASARACIFAFIPFSSFIIEGKPLCNGSELRGFIQEAQYLVSEILDGNATLDGIQALLMLSICRLGQISTMNSIEPMFTTSIRFIFILGGHLNLAAQETPALFQVHCRSLFWIAYVMDNEICLRTCRPPAICADYCDLTLPSESEIATEFCLPHLQIPYIQILPFLFPSDLRLASIQSKITKALHSPQAASKSDAELLKTIRELDDVVDGWHKSLQLPDDPSAFPAQGVMTRDEAFGSSFMLLVQYKYCIIAIHQMSTGCAAWIADPEALGIKLSLEVAANASRALLQQFLGAKAVFQLGGFW
ncbi:hypothetical protein N7456_007708 [Penicillium angulare]|uniref:Xylanolytic transcriptional activator regulatory domain-containing protein n=1 Tax=Penicillium angulare TaxID=116970 RepID=A0A9W9FB64_9EURO|nr:hypothetical protein N7456_007708 [Penicillium angulare]